MPSGDPEFHLHQRLLRTWLRQSPGAGRAVSELVTYGEFRTLDLSEVGYERVLEGRRFEENAALRELVPAVGRSAAT